MPFVPVSLWRIGIYVTDRNSHRCICSQTWAIDGVYGGSQFSNVLNRLVPLLRRPFGDHDDLRYDWPFYLTEQLWPRKLLGGAFSLTPNLTAPALNLNAQEAAFRLQRVGSTPAPGKIGRMTYPILSDRYYTDLPHRRHVDVDLLQSYIDAADDPGRYVQTEAGITMKQVIWHRQSSTFAEVDHFELRSNPVRIWQRWRPYDWRQRQLHDAAYQPDELT